MRGERIAAGTVAGLIMAAVWWATTAAGQPAPTDAQLFDLALAQRELDALESQIRSTEEQIAEALADIDDLALERDFLDLNRPARAAQLQEVRGDARRMAVAAYVNIGPPLSGFEMLDAETASEVSWRNAILRHQSERLTMAAEIYAVLAGETDANVLALTDEIDAETRRLEALQRELIRLGRRVPTAEWYVEIATIHAEATSEFQRTGRNEPNAEQWRQLRFCESTENYAVDSSNGFFGAYQFTAETWQTVGGEGNPALAPAAEQDARARLLFSRRGSQPWPICGRYLD